jgi:hypothetical protein
MRCPNCQKDEIWADATFCPRCGKQLITIIPNVKQPDCEYIEGNCEEFKIRLQMYQIAIWAFLTTASFAFISGIAQTNNLWITFWVLILGGFVGFVVEWSLKESYKKYKKNNH